METKDIFLLGVRNTVIAFDRGTGRELWRHEISSGGLLSGGEFVSLLADKERVFVHARGTLSCLDLQTGVRLWNDELSGLGFGVATMAFPDGLSNIAETACETLRQAQAQAAHTVATHQ